MKTYDVTGKVVTLMARDDKAKDWQSPRRKAQSDGAVKLKEETCRLTLSSLF